MADDKEIGVRITAKNAGLTDGLNQATAGVKQAVSQMEGHFAGLNSAISNLKAPFLALSGLLAGGALFKAAIDETIEWTGEVVKLSKVLGISKEEASGLADAMEKLGVGGDQAVSAVYKLNMALRTNEAELNKNGVATKDVKGNMLPMMDIFWNTIEATKKMAEGYDRDQMMLLAFGRGAKELGGILRMTKEQVAESAKQMEELGLTVTDEKAERVRNYKIAMEEFGEVFKAIKVSIGSDLIPVLAELAMTLRDLLAPVVGVVGTVFKYLVGFVMEAANGLYQFFFIVYGVVNTIGTALWGTTQALMALVQGDLTGAKNAMVGIGTQVKATWTEILDYMDQTQEKHNARMARLMGNSHAGAEGKGPGKATSKFKPKGDDKSDDVLRGFKTELEKRKALEENWFTWSVGRELDFWQGKLAHTTQGTKAYLAILTEVNKLRKEKAKEDHEAYLEDLKMQMDAAKGDFAKKFELQAAYTKEEARLHGEGSKQFIQSKREEAKLWEDLIAKTGELRIKQAEGEKNHALAMVALDEETLRHRVAMGEASANEEADAQREILKRKETAELAQLQTEMANREQDLASLQEYMNKKKAIQEQYQLERMKLNNKEAEDSKKAWASFLDPIQASMASAFQGLLSASQGWGQAWKGFMVSIGKTFDQQVAGMVAKWIMGESLKTQATAGSVMAQVALTAWASLKKAAIWAWEGLKYIVTEGYKAAAGAYSAIVSIPYVGPFLAPVAAGVALAAVMSMAGRISSAAGGWGKVPGDQLAQIHKDEMVLPAQYADGLRAMLEHGGGGQQPVQVTYQVSAIDARGVQQFLQAHGPALSDAVAKQVRNGRFA